MSNRGSIENQVETNNKKFNFFQEINEWLKSLIFALIIALLLMKYVFFIAIVPTGSMQPNIDIGDRIVVWKCFRYLDWNGYKNLDYGDVVVFMAEEVNGFKENQLLVKRVIGLGGDTIKIEEGKVYRNGVKLEEPYIKNNSITFMTEIKVPDGEIFVLGDNRGNSNDSRFWVNKTFKTDRVIGEVILR